MMGDSSNSSEGGNWWQDIIDEFPDNYSYDNYCCEGGDVCNMTSETDFEATYIPVLYSVTFVVGILGNGVLLGVLFHSRRAWSVTDTFIFHLSVADVLLLVTLPLWAAQSAEVEGWTFSSPLCKITGTVYTINFYCGIFLLACISLDRYLSIVHATQMYSRRKPWVVQVSCLVVWFFSLVLSIPDWILLDVVSDERRHRSECVRDYSKFGLENIASWKMASRLLYHIVGFLLPSAVLIFCYTCILRQLRCGNQGLQKQRAFKVIIAVVVVFFVCWTPYNVTLVADTIHQSNGSETCGVRTDLEKAKMVTSSLGYLHCSLNPILYAFVGVKFRRQLLSILRSLGFQLRPSTSFQSTLNRRSSLWSESGDTSKTIAI